MSSAMYCAILASLQGWGVPKMFVGDQPNGPEMNPAIALARKDHTDLPSHDLEQ
ncbi:MAG: hypothetical protein HC812_13700 [Leptolyngbya sp. RL_3_1]|nr:hypothetical protein [Leptolyngbya sp. RL_3_1]